MIKNLNQDLSFLWPGSTVDFLILIVALTGEALTIRQALC